MLCGLADGGLLHLGMHVGTQAQPEYGEAEEGGKQSIVEWIQRTQERARLYRRAMQSSPFGDMPLRGPVPLPA